MLGTHLGLNADIHILAADSQGSGGLVLSAGLTLGSRKLRIRAADNFGEPWPSLLVNTTSADLPMAWPKNTYQVELDNASFSVAGFQASGTLIVGVSNSVFAINVPASNPVSVSFFGLGNVNIYVFINSNGQFSLNGSVGFDFELAGTGLYGSISASEQQRLLRVGVCGGEAAGAGRRLGGRVAGDRDEPRARRRPGRSSASRRR